MHKEVINDLRMVYYRGCYRAATAWSKIGNAPGPENQPGKEAAARANAVEILHPEARSGVKSTA